jgi:hypothetical protein
MGSCVSTGQNVCFKKITNDAQLILFDNILISFSGWASGLDTATQSDVSALVMLEGRSDDEDRSASFIWLNIVLVQRAY